MSYNTRKRVTNIQPSNSSTRTNIPTEYDWDYSDSGSEYKASDSPSETEEDTSEDSTDSKDNSDKEKFKKTAQTPAKIEQNEFAKDNKVYVIKSDDYFAHTSQKKALISKNDLGTFETPRFHHDELQKLLNEQLTLKHNNELEILQKSNCKQFNRWLYLMQEGFNLLLYGLGSKITIVKDFQLKCLGNVPVIVVNGFFPSLSIRSIIEAITGVLQLSDVSPNIYEACGLIDMKLSCLPTLNLYLIVHNIEGDMLKNSKAQTALSKLAAIRNLHLLATVDHVSAPLIWDNSKLSKFNFIWSDCTSFLPYTEETALEGSSIAQRSKTLALSSLSNVFLSLTSNSKGIYRIIVKHQLERGNVQHYQGFLFKDLYWACREAFLVSSDLALRSQLTEFVDHKMLRFRRSPDGSEYLVIPTAMNILQQFYDEQS